MNLTKEKYKGTIVSHLVQYTYGGGMEDEDNAYPLIAQFFCGQSEELSGSGSLASGTYFRDGANCQDCIRKYYALEREELTTKARGEKT